MLSETARGSDVVIVGAGIVGLATAHYLSRQYPGRRLIIVEKEPEVAVHQTGHNSGVLHSGIYYAPGSQKARLCRAGKAMMEAFCEEQGIAYEICGKVIVATDAQEEAVLQRIAERGEQNAVRFEAVDARRLRELEPHAAGVAALHVLETSIVDFRQVAVRLASLLQQAGHAVCTGTAVTGIRESGRRVVVETTAGALETGYVVTCAGLYADRVAAMAGARLEVEIVPFRGEYYRLKPAAAHLCRNLIYPVPDRRFPFLGVHFTRLIHGGVECGPNAVLAFAREGYRWRDLNARELARYLRYGGFLRLAARYWRTGAGEMQRSLSKRAFARGLQRLVPAVRAEDLEAAPAGVRSQAVTRDGYLLDDFAFHESARAVHVLNAPSPAATASLAIGQHIGERLASRW